MRTVMCSIMILAGASACANPVEDRVKKACEVAFVDPAGERTTYDSIGTICKCFSKGTGPMEKGNYLKRVELAMSQIAERRARDGTAWPDAYVAIEHEYTLEDNQLGLEALSDAVERLSAAQQDLKDDRCEGLF